MPASSPSSYLPLPPAQVLQPVEGADHWLEFKQPQAFDALMPAPLDETP